MMNFPKGFKQREQQAAARRAQLQRDMSIREQRASVLFAKEADAVEAAPVEPKITSAASMVTVNPEPVAPDAPVAPVASAAEPDAPVAPAVEAPKPAKKAAKKAAQHDASGALVEED